MSNDRLSRHLLIAFVLALGLYVAGYSIIEGRRTRHTPWRVEFTPETNSHSLLLTINQESLRLGPTQVRIRLAPDAGLPPTNSTVRFAEPHPVPFLIPGGSCVFQDTTFLPGSVALEIGRVPVQFLPRTLTVGTNEYSWSQPAPIEVNAPVRSIVRDESLP